MILTWKWKWNFESWDNNKFEQYTLSTSLWNSFWKIEKYSKNVRLTSMWVKSKCPMVDSQVSLWYWLESENEILKVEIIINLSSTHWVHHFEIGFEKSMKIENGPSMWVESSQNVLW